VLPGFREAVVTVDPGAGRRPGRYRPQEKIATVHEALVLGLEGLPGQVRFQTKAVMGLSGGLIIAVTCLPGRPGPGPGKRYGVVDASPYTSRDSIDDSLVLARNLGVETRLIPITPFTRATGRP